MVINSCDVQELTDSLSMLIEEEDLSAKIRINLSTILTQLNSNVDVEGMLKVQDDLENISNMNNLTDFCRNELINIISLIDTMINS